MSRRMWMVGLAMALLVGCERNPTDSAVPQPAPQAPTTQTSQVPSTRPEPSPPATSVVVVDGEPLLFPPARLRLEPRDGHVWARLFSEQPPPDVREPFVHNSYYFDMRLDVEDVEQVPSAVWSYKALSHERADSPNGIFLRDLRDHLQPDDVQIEFTKEGDELIVHIVGRFLPFQERALIPAQPVLVEATLKTRPQVK